jgi:hypothetical protein
MNAPPNPRSSTVVALSTSRAVRANELIAPIIERLQQALDAENEQIASGKRIDYEAFNLRKSQGLLELTRLTSMVAGAEATPALRTALGNLRAKLEVNQRLLKVQLSAARKVSDIIARAIHEGQSDGTYSAYAWREPAE